MFKYGLSLVVVFYAGIPSLNSSTNCNCRENVQNARCVIEPKQKKGCSFLVCNDGYWGESCQFGRLRLTNRNGYITDGANNYTSLSKRMWLIEPENSNNSSIHFEIDELVTECNWDHLYIFDGGSIYAPQLVALNGHLIAETSSNHAVIPQEIVAKSGKAYIYFYSDVRVEKAGFNISYSIVENCPCSSNGRCNAAGLCLCNPGWSGVICDVKMMNCANCSNGFCNETLGYCVCDNGFTGEDCGQPVTLSYWRSVHAGGTDDSVYPRASHSAAIIGDSMWVYKGYTSHQSGSTHQQHMLRYNLNDNTWEDGIVDLGLKHRWGHTMIAYQSSLIVFGGVIKNTIVKRLEIFPNNSSKFKEYGLEPSDAVAVTGHTATMVGKKMIVISGLGINGLSPQVQEYDIENSKWKIIEPKSSFVTARYGHTSVYDQYSRRIYVYGGLQVLSANTVNPTDSLIAYLPSERSWISLTASGFKQTLHSAVILDNMMLVYGGNPYVYHDQKHTKCHSSKLLAFDFACQQWKTTELPQLPRRLARYGHTAVAKGREMYIFGGFNGAFFNDVLTYSHGDCSMILNETECHEKYYSAGCSWSNGICVNKGSLSSLPKCPLKHQKKCLEYKLCQECISSPFDCGWSGGACKDGGDKTCGQPPMDSCSHYYNCNSCYAAGCFWMEKTSKCTKTAKTGQTKDCPKSCTERHESLTCLDNSKTCLWCESLERCIESHLYVFYYQYGQCLEWTKMHSKDKAVTCTDKKNCQDCHTLPGCGWCEGSERNGNGRCQKGTDTAPINQATCKAHLWHFIGCPACQCHGHSNCSSNSSVCLACGDNTTGANCETCAPGYFGDSLNDGLCKPCQCNGHADKCDASSGECSCIMRGAEGVHCDKCASQYEGNATNGGSCYYKLQPDYLYRINVSDKTIFNFICYPGNSDKDTIITVDITKKNKDLPAKLNISVGSGTYVKNELLLLTHIELLSEYQEKFSKASFKFGSNNFHFKIYVYDITPFSSISVSVHQPDDQGINLLQFFIIFLACFIGLLVLAVFFWKVKASYDSFRSTRRRNVELVYMTNRPFASVPVCIDKAESIPLKNKPSALTSEICYGNKAAVVTVLFRMPVCAQKQNASGAGTRAGALCLGSTLVSINEHHGSKMMNYMKTAKRRRNPFRSSPT